MTDDPRRALAGGLAPLPADLLQRVGEALYGPHWVAALARDLNVQHRTVERWRVGDARITPRIAPDLLALLQARAATQAALVEELAPLALAAADQA
jgi:hypothetical protein